MSSGRTALSDFVAQTTRSLAGFGATLYIARVLGADTLGAYALVVALLFWFKFPLGSVSTAVSKRVSEGTDASSYLGGGAVLTGGFALVVVVVTLSARGQINQYVGRSVATLLAVLLVGNVVFDYVHDALVGQKRVAAAGWLGTLERVARTGLQISLVVVGFEFFGLVAGHAASLLLIGSFGFWLFRRRPTFPRLYHLKRLISYARYSWLGSLKGTAMGWVDTVVLGLFVSTQFVGVYEASWALASILALSANSITTTLFPEFSELATEDNYQAILEFVGDALAFVGIILLPGFVGALLIGPRVLQIYGPEFVIGGVVLNILVLSRTFDAFASLFTNTLNGIDRPELTFRINGVYVVTNLVLNVLLVSQFGWVGAAVATAVSSFVVLVLGVLAVARVVGRPSVPSSVFKHQLVSASVMGLVVWRFARVLPHTHVMTVVLIGTGATAYTCTLLWLSRPIRTRLFDVLSL